VTAVQSPTPAAAKAPLARRDLIALAIPAVVGALLCAIELNTRSLWLDEGSTFAIASQHGAALWRGIAHDGGNMLLYYLLIHVVISLFGSAAWVLRLPSVAATAATGALTAAFGLRLLADRRQAAAAGLLTIVGLPLVFSGQDARGYALMVTLATASMLAFAMLVEHDSRRVMAAYVVCTAAMLYVGYDAALLILAQLALLPFFRERIRTVIGCLAAVVVLCVPLVVLAAERGSGQLFWVAPLTFSVFRGSMATLVSAALPSNFPRTTTATPTAVLIGLLLLAGLVGAYRVLRRTLSRRTVSSSAEGRLALVAAWLVIPLVVTVLLSIAGEPVEVWRFVLLLIPSVGLLLAWTIARLPAARIAAPALLAVILALRVLQLAPTYGWSFENWKAAAADVARDTASQTACVAFYPQDGRESFDYYVRGTAAAKRLAPVLPSLGWGTVRPLVEQYDTFTTTQWLALANCRTLFLVASHQGSRTGTASSRVDWARYLTIQRELDRRYPSHTVAKFGWAATVTVTRYSRSGPSTG
jgi:hypothetical protein